MFVEKPFSLMSRVDQDTKMVLKSLAQLTFSLAHISGLGGAACTYIAAFTV